MNLRLATCAALAALLFAPASGFTQGAGTAPAGPATPTATPPATAPATPPAASPPAARGAAPARPAATTPAARTATPAALPAGQFKTEAEAKAHCPGDTVVWANKESRIYHLHGERYYGKTKSGAFMCQKEAGPAGFRAPRGHTQPTTRATAPAAPSAPATPAQR